MKYARFGDLQIGDRFNTAQGGKIVISSGRIFQKIAPTFAIVIQPKSKSDEYVKKHIALSMPVIIRNEISVIEFDHEKLIHEFDS